MFKKENFQFILVLLISLGFGLTIRSTCFSIHRVTGTSMVPAFHSGSFVLSMERPLMNWLGIKINHGDVVIVESKNMPPLAKRAMAFENDSIWIEDFNIYINGQILKENFNRVRKNKVDCAYSELFHVPKNHVFLMGDNFCKSFDSRIFGAASLDDIRGKVLWVIYKGKEDLYDL
ncbi:MAG: signal peptidase I [Bdellovibrionales bacterium]|nr:signal peptidase I [Bdellovibrionales bacterium]